MSESEGHDMLEHPRSIGDAERQAFENVLLVLSNESCPINMLFIYWNLSKRYR